MPAAKIASPPFPDSSPSFSVLAAYAVGVALTAAAAVAPGLVPPNAHMLVLSLCIVHVGSHLSLCAAGGEAGGSERVSAGEAAQLPLLRMEKPGLKQSQYREMAWKAWQKAPENPVGSRLV